MGLDELLNAAVIRAAASKVPRYPIPPTSQYQNVKTSGRMRRQGLEPEPAD